MKINNEIRRFVLNDRQFFFESTLYRLVKWAGFKVKKSKIFFPRLICLGVMGTMKREPLKIDDSPHEFIPESPDQFN